MIQSVTLIGAGNLATHLGIALFDVGIEIRQVYSRTEQSAKELAVKLSSAFTVNLSDVDVESDLVIIAIKDDAMVPVLEQIDLKDRLVVHVAGSVPMSLLSDFSCNYGVFYPLQTFSKNREISFKNIPVCLEACNESVLIQLNELAEKITDHVVEISSEQRKSLHVAAVFSCNFVNHFYQLAYQLLEEKGLPFDIMKPLITETAAKVQSLKPIDAQTGPAVRFDESIINKQLDALSGNPELRKIYSFVTESIYKTHNKS